MTIAIQNPPQIPVPCSATSDGADARLHALSESRERWRALVALGGDLGFETDGQGCFTVLAPDLVLGWPAERLIGTRAQALLVPEAGMPATRLFNPFHTRVAVRRRRVWLREAGGSSICMLISVAPVPGKPGAVRGLGIDMTGQERHDARLAATLLRREMARMVAQRMRHVAFPFASLTTALAELIKAVDGHGTSLGNSLGTTLVLHSPEAPLRVAARAGQPWPAPLQALHDAILADCENPPTWSHEHTRQITLCGQSLLPVAGTNHFIDRAILTIWREGPAWSDDEIALVAGLLPAMQPVLEHEQIQRETARLSRTDILTGLFNRQGFNAELARRLERLDQEGLPATLMVVGLDGFGSINMRDGLEVGDIALRAAATFLRDLVRPTDLVARLGGDLFALWLDGADQFAAAERADHLRRAGIVLGAAPGGEADTRIAVSIGLAIRSSRSFESIDSLLHRAWAAMHAVKLAGGGQWQVSSEEPTP